MIETERLVLRRPAMGDFDAFAAFLASERSRFVGGPRTEPREAWRAFAHIAGMWALRGYGPFIATLSDTGAPIGMAGPWHPFDWPEREIAWSIWSAGHEGRGLAIEAARAAARHAFDTLGWPGAVHYIDPDNARSIALARRLGARPDRAATPPDPGILVFRTEADALRRESDGKPTRFRLSDSTPEGAP